ncbi:MAG: CoA transferase [Bacteroidia bacterium]|nr:CoA transferase [Bacteroidia bacterium]
MLFKNHIVIELASVLAGPSVGMFFAELGATVLKVENLPLNGDVTRTWKLNAESADAVSSYFSSVNWGKKSIAIDLKQKEGQEIVYKLLAKADFVISSFLPGAATKIGMDAETLLSVNPRLICGEINGYGETVERAAFDAIIQAEAGFTMMNGEGKNIYKMPVALMDLLAAHQLKEAMLLAYIERMSTGKGKRVSVSLIESGISSLANQATNWLVAGQIPAAIGSEHPNIVPYGTLFYTADHKPVVLAIGNDSQFAQLCAVLSLPVPDAFLTNPQRVQNREAVNNMLQAAIGKISRETLLSDCIREKIPAGAVNNLQEVFQGEYARKILLEKEGKKGVKTFVSPQFESPLLSSPPKLNADAAEICEIAGISPDELNGLYEKKVLKRGGG